MIDVKGRDVTVVGLARSGVAAANLLAGMGARVTVTDSKPESALAEQVAKLSPGVARALGAHPDELFTKADLVVISPGVPLTAPPIMKAAEAGVELMGELELAYSVSDSPFIAITGTNGKSTTTTLVGEMLKEAGMKVLVGGNLGNALTDEPDKLMGRDFIVAEVSSFQLEAIDRFRPKIAAILNVTPDHLDRYASMKEYAEAKALVFANQGPADVLVVNADDAITMELRGGAASKTVLFSRKKVLREGVFVHGGSIVNGMNEGSRVNVVPVSELGIKGAHNLENALAATAVAIAAGVPMPVIARTLRMFAGLEHRLEFVRELDGATYMNDSKGTNVGAVEKSLESFDAPVILIAGGLDKHGDFPALGPLVKERVKRLVLIGKAADAIDAAIGSLTETVRADSMEDAVRKSREAASPGDVVLLSPACASFDMFKDFEDRGRKFKEAVNKL